MIFKISTILLLGVATFQLAYSRAKCTANQAIASVEHVCKIVEGDSTKKNKKRAIKKYKYCEDNYVWVQKSTENGRVIMQMHPHRWRELNDTDVAKLADANGKKIFVEFKKAVQNKPHGSWVEYIWPKPGEDIPTPKKSYVKLCPGKLGWIAGSGIWFDK